jgi:hypothetical protein
VAFTRPKPKFNAVLLPRYDPDVSHIVVSSPVAPRTVAAGSSHLREWWEGVGAGERAFEEHWAGKEVVGWGTTVNHREPAVAAL